jgi:hypothetical protein
MLLHESWMASHEHKSSQAVRLAEQAISSARQKGIPYAGGLGHYHLGRFLPAIDPRRTEQSPAGSGYL